MKTKWGFYILTKLTVLAASLKDVSIGCKDGELPKLLEKNHTVNCLTYEENTRQPFTGNLCFFLHAALFLHRNQRLEEKTSKTFDSFINRIVGLSPNQFTGVHMICFPVVEDLLTLNILLYGLDIVDGNIIGELARLSVQNCETNV